MPYRGPSDACVITLLMSLYLVAFSRMNIRSITDTLGLRHRRPCQWAQGYLAHSLDSTSRMMFWVSLGPSCHSFPQGTTMVFWVVLMAWMWTWVPSVMPRLSRITLAREAKQLMVEEALLTILRVLSNLSWFMSKHGGISRKGRGDEDPSGSILQVSPNFVQSSENTSGFYTMFGITSPHLMWAGACSWKMEMGLPWTTWAFLFSALAVP